MTQIPKNNRVKGGIMRSRILDLDDEMDVIKSLMAGLEESG